MTSLISRARELATITVTTTQPHVLEAMRVLVEMADECERLRSNTIGLVIEQRDAAPDREDKLRDENTRLTSALAEAERERDDAMEYRDRYLNNWNHAANEADRARDVFDAAVAYCEGGNDGSLLDELFDAVERARGRRAGAP